MRILYGVQGTGNGHITRARHMAESLSKVSDIHVDYLFSGRSKDAYFDMQEFHQYNTRRGLTFITDRGQVKYANTVLNNNLFELCRDVSNLDVSHYDLIINDFEPISAWAAYKKGVPSLSISHQAAFLHQVPKQDQGYIDKLVTKYFAPTKYSLGTHWYHFGHELIPPVISKDMTDAYAKSMSPEHLNAPILVYLPFESLKDISSQLSVLSDQKFICYHPSISQQGVFKNIVYQPLSKANFKKDLITCSGVISNCGFELSTECLSLGKALLVKPLKKQYEQTSNAYTLKQLGLCEWIMDFNAEDIDDWLQTKQGVQIDFPSNCDNLVAWIQKGNWQQTEEICSTLWKQVNFPASVKSRLDAMMSV